MRAILLAASLCTIAAPALADGYTNARFGYTLTYPARTFTPQPEPDNGDGRHLKALSGEADLAVWGAYNALNQSASDIANGVASNCAPAPQPYRLIKPTVVVVSCPTPGGILYHKTYIRGDVLTTFELTYPASQRARWDAVVGEITLAPAK
jgi:hypothetical protein